MKESRWLRKYLKMSDSAKLKAAREWCMRFLRLDIDKMSSDEFYELIDHYEYLVEYPENPGFFRSHFFPIISFDSKDMTAEEIDKILSEAEDETPVRNTFKDYQKLAKEIMADFRNIKSKSGDWLKFDTKLLFTVKVRKNHEFEMYTDDEHNFKYSYARQIARFLRGRKFDDVIKKCPNCDHYFAVLSKHGKQCCSHKCAMLFTSRRRFAENPTLAKRQRNINSYFSVLKKKGVTDRQMRRIMRKYKKERNYRPEEIPPYIDRFLKGK